jgi:hypothetical protein
MASFEEDIDHSRENGSGRGEAHLPSIPDPAPPPLTTRERLLLSGATDDTDGDAMTLRPEELRTQ